MRRNLPPAPERVIHSAACSKRTQLRNKFALLPWNAGCYGAGGALPRRRYAVRTSYSETSFGCSGAFPGKSRQFSRHDVSNAVGLIAVARVIGIVLQIVTVVIGDFLAGANEAIGHDPDLAFDAF